MTYRSLKTSSQTTYFLPRFHIPVSEFRALPRFWSEMVTYQVWRETVKTGGSYPGKCLLGPLSLVFRDACVSLQYVCYLLPNNRETSYSTFFVNGLQVYEV